MKFIFRGEEGGPTGLGNIPKKTIFLLLPIMDRKGLKVVTIEIIEIVTTIIVTTFKRCNNLNML